MQLAAGGAHIDDSNTACDQHIAASEASGGVQERSVCGRLLTSACTCCGVVDGNCQAGAFFTSSKDAADMRTEREAHTTQVTRRH